MAKRHLYGDFFLFFVLAFASWKIRVLTNLGVCGKIYALGGWLRYYEKYKDYGCFEIKCSNW